MSAVLRAFLRFDALVLLALAACLVFAPSLYWDLFSPSSSRASSSSHHDNDGDDDTVHANNGGGGRRAAVLDLAGTMLAAGLAAIALLLLCATLPVNGPSRLGRPFRPLGSGPTPERPWLAL